MKKNLIILSFIFFISCQTDTYQMKLAQEAETFSSERIATSLEAKNKIVKQIQDLDLKVFHLEQEVLQESPWEPNSELRKDFEKTYKLAQKKRDSLVKLLKK